LDNIYVTNKDNKMKSIIKKELKLINENANYYGSKDQIENEKLIYTFAFKDLGIELKYNESIEEFYTRLIKAY
jgi:hypothetical protein